MVFAGGGDVLKLLAEVAAGEVGSAGAGGVDVGDGEAGVVGHGYQGGLAEAGVALDGDVVGVDGGVGGEVVQQARASPGPCAEYSPVVELAGLPVIGEADDALGKAGAVVGLDGGGLEQRVAPALRKTSCFHSVGSAMGPGGSSRRGCG